MPDLLEDHIARISKKLQLLVNQHVVTKKQIEKLTQKNEELKLLTKEFAEKVSQLEQQVLILKTSVQKLEGPEKKAFEKSINSFIKTIEQAIATISH